MTTAQNSEGLDNQKVERGTLPEAPLAMPRQVLESQSGGSFLRTLLLRTSRAGH